MSEWLRVLSVLDTVELGELADEWGVDTSGATSRKDLVQRVTESAGGSAEPDQRQASRAALIACGRLSDRVTWSAVLAMGGAVLSAEEESVERGAREALEEKFPGQLDVTARRDERLDVTWVRVAVLEEGTVFGPAALFCVREGCRVVLTAGLAECGVFAREMLEAVVAAAGTSEPRETGITGSSVQALLDSKEVVAAATAAQQPPAKKKRGQPTVVRMTCETQEGEKVVLTFRGRRPTAGVNEMKRTGVITSDADVDVVE